MKARLGRRALGGRLERRSQEIYARGLEAMASVGGPPWDLICAKALDRMARMTDRRVRMTRMNQQTFYVVAAVILWPEPSPRQSSVLIMMTPTRFRAVMVVQ